VPDKKELDLELRLMAIEYVLALIGKITLLNAGITSEQAQQMRKNGREAMLKETFPGLDATMADHVGAELADRVEALLNRIEILVAETYQKVSRGEF
jgi:hypothetical protein